MRNHSPALLIISFLLTGVLAGCAKTRPTKVFPQGDAFDPTAVTRSDSDDPATTAAPRRIQLPPRQEDRGLRLSMAIDPTTVRAGQPVYVAMTIRNTTTNAVTVAYSSEKRFDVVAFGDQEQRSIEWVHSENAAFATIFQEVVLGPGATTKRIIEIPTTRLEGSNRDGRLRPGSYWIYGTHEGAPALSTGPIKIEIVE
jgi:hypothetical protein